MTLFGPAGNSDSFRSRGYKTALEAPGYVAGMGLDAFEYQCGRGVRISSESAKALGEEAKKHSVRYSLHAPYYISMSSTEEEKRLGSIQYILQSARAVTDMGGDRIVVHTGSCGSISRAFALELAMDTMKKALAALDGEALGGVHICPEVMGKINQLGTLEEVLELCRLDDRLIPCIDFGHLNARTFGSLKGPGDFKSALDAVENSLGRERMQSIHIHFSKIEYTGKGGEKRHLTFEDMRFGPDFDHLAGILWECGCQPTIICESAGTQAEDAAAMKAAYLAAKP